MPSKHVSSSWDPQARKHNLSDFWNVKGDEVNLIFRGRTFHNVVFGLFVFLVLFLLNIDWAVDTYFRLSYWELAGKAEDFTPQLSCHWWRAGEYGGRCPISCLPVWWCWWLKLQTGGPVGQRHHLKKEPGGNESIDWLIDWLMPPSPIFHKADEQLPGTMGGCLGAVVAQN